jgi:3'(2'), 5'-bisphosphate nucleotidase
MVHEHLELAIKAALAAGDKIMEIRDSGDLGTREKSDRTLVTLADTEAQRIILNILSESNIPIQGEEYDPELAEYNARLLTVGENPTTFWSVDPVDGTRDLAEGIDDFVVSIALVNDHHSRLGVIYAPARKQLWFADQDTPTHYSEGAEIAVGVRQVVKWPDKLVSFDDATMLVSPSMMKKDYFKEFIKAINKENMITEVGSTALRLALLTEGNAESYISLLHLDPENPGLIRDWDIAAADIILQKAGGCLATLTGYSPRYTFNAPKQRNGAIGYRNVENHPDYLKQMQPHLPK